MNFFEVFNLAISFELDTDELEESYLALQNKLHPDTESGDVEKSEVLNSAYSTLKNPLKRAIYLLKIKSGINLDDDANNIAKPSPELLMKIFEERDKVNTEISSDKKLLSEYRKSLISRISEKLSESVKDINESGFDNAAQNLIEAKYLDKILQDIKIHLTK